MDIADAVTTEYVDVNPGTRVGKLRGIFDEDQTLDGIVVRGEGKFDGLVTRKELVSSVRIGFPKVEDEDSLTVYRVDEPERQLEPGYQDIPEPDPDKTRSLDVQRLDLVLVPGLMFDQDGFRVGYGGGFYDRFLNQIPGTTVTVGVGYEFQVRDRVPRMEHDEPVDHVTTPGRVIDSG